MAFVLAEAHWTKNFALQQIFEKLWEYAKVVNALFVDLEKAYNCIPGDKLWEKFLQYGTDGQLLTGIKLLNQCTCIPRSMFVSIA